MSEPIRFIMVGGFLGAGKTTTLGRLAAHYQTQGKSVGIVTNDQASDLVDTNTLRSQGFDVGEVAGACFCCSFNDLMQTMERLGTESRPDVILAEPVGSCTDLVATVIQPIKKMYEAEFSIAPYAVILKPSHGQKILGQGRSGFSPKAEYILKKQLEEADLILLNRIDELDAEEVSALLTLLEQNDPVTPVLKISARTGDGFDALTEFLDQQGDFGRKVLDIDYDTYADGEAELGWLNSSVRVIGDASFSLDDLLLKIVNVLREKLLAAGYEPAHLKTIGLWEGFFGVANLISSDTNAELSLASQQSVKEIDLIVNARVSCDPTELETMVGETLQEVTSELGLRYENRSTQSFRPGRPEPTHRIAAADIV